MKRMLEGDELKFISIEDGKFKIIPNSKVTKEGMLSNTMITYHEVQRMFGEFHCDISVENLNLITKEQLIKLSKFGNLYYDQNDESKQALGNIIGLTGLDDIPKEFSDLLIEIANLNE